LKRERSPLFAGLGVFPLPKGELRPVWSSREAVKPSGDGR